MTATSNTSPSRLTSAVFSSRRDQWTTPDALLDLLDAEFDFDMDVAASSANAKCDKYFTAEDDGLTKLWTGTVWCNPPYGAVKDWMAKPWESGQLDGATVVCLVPARTSTRWWHRYAMRADEVRLVKGRLTFTRPDGTGKAAPFPSAVLVFRPSAKSARSLGGQQRLSCAARRAHDSSQRTRIYTGATPCRTPPRCNSTSPFQVPSPVRAAGATDSNTSST